MVDIDDESPNTEDVVGDVVVLVVDVDVVLVVTSRLVLPNGIVSAGAAALHPTR
ncbi:hypothetical protein [Nannocystis punicea]|uniref:Uncharacterized protein n=1 Tax=Nannocystis punicea TaxID=2995304 RepID=A0ABY7GZN6_9BACT|nr:hypothetical protein [Nannocystis poenicansa]WAS92473.1 hypothetical protein O0S08_40355 [Nannocystis poenicansa]